MMPGIIGSFCLAGALLAATAQDPLPGETQKTSWIAVRLNGEILTWDDVLKGTGLTASKVTAEKLRARLLERAEILLYRQAARQNGISVTVKEISDRLRREMTYYGSREEYEETLRLRGRNLNDERDYFYRELLVLKLHRHFMEKAWGGEDVSTPPFVHSEIPPGQLRRYFKEHREEFRAIDRVTAVHLLLGFQNEEEKAKTRQVAESLLRKLGEGADFSILAHFYSEGPKEQLSHTLNRADAEKLFSKSTVTLLFEKMKEGEVSGIVEEKKSLNLFKLLQRVKKKDQSFREAQPSVRLYLESERRKKNRALIRESLLKRTYVRPRGLFDGSAPVSHPRFDGWFGRGVGEIRIEGAGPGSHGIAKKLITLQRGQPLTAARLDGPCKALFETGRFGGVAYSVSPDPSNAGNVIVGVHLEEYPSIERVRLSGAEKLPPAKLEPSLRLAAGGLLNPSDLKRDRDVLRKVYLSEGFADSRIEEKIEPLEQGVVLTWNVVEGPRIAVREIVFTGNRSKSEADLRRILRTGQDPGGSEPYVERYLLDDLERIKLIYMLDGWLDILDGERVVLEDRIFNPDKTRVTLGIRIDEGPRYTVRGVRVAISAAARGLVTEMDLRRRMKCRRGGFYVDQDANDDMEAIRRRYFLKARRPAEVRREILVAEDESEDEVIFTVDRKGKR